MCWPVSLAPAEVVVLPLQTGDDVVEPLARELACALEDAGVEVAFDDRDERAGVKFADADLVGWPYQLVVGKRGAKEGKVEFKDRACGEKVELPVAEAAAHIAAAVADARRALEPTTSIIDDLL